MKEDANDLICRLYHLSGRIADIVDIAEGSITFRHGEDSYIDSF